MALPSTPFALRGRSASGAMPGEGDAVGGVSASIAKSRLRITQGSITRRTPHGTPHTAQPGATRLI